MSEVKIGDYIIKIDDNDLWRIIKYQYYSYKRMGKTYFSRRKYNKITKKDKTFCLHREIMKTKKDMECDHINGDTLDNRKCNLRNCTHKQNLYNQKIQIHTANKAKGVEKISKNRYRARIYPDDKAINLGSYNSIKEAAIAYNQAAIKYYGQYARLNPINHCPDCNGTGEKGDK